jgi:FMN-dependent NADH-azoreductase
MKTVLHINSSARIERSHTRGLTDLFLQEWRGLRPQDHIISRDIGVELPPAVNDGWVEAAFTSPPDRTAAMRQVLRLSELMVDELLQADLIVLGAPMYNFGMPAQLKAYVDQIVRIGRTFSFDPANEKQPYTPLLTGKQMLVVTATGDAGYQPGGPLAHMNHLDPHIRTAFGFIGIQVIQVIGVNSDEFSDHRIKHSLASAQVAIEEYAREQAGCDCTGQPAAQSRVAGLEVSHAEPSNQ